MDKEILTTFEAARYCHVHPGTIKNWIKRESLKAFKTPGGHRRIYKRDLDKFLTDNNIPIDQETRSPRKRILLLEADFALREEISKILLRWGALYEVAPVSNSFEAGEMMVLFRPDLVILDERIPGIEAAEICRHIRSAHYLDGIGIIGLVSSGQDADNLVREADCTVAKPLEAHRLKDAIDRLPGLKSFK